MKGDQLWMHEENLVHVGLVPREKREETSMDLNLPL